MTMRPVRQVVRARSLIRATAHAARKPAPLHVPAPWRERESNFDKLRGYNVGSRSTGEARHARHLRPSGAAYPSVIFLQLFPTSSNVSTRVDRQRRNAVYRFAGESKALGKFSNRIRFMIALYRVNLEAEKYKYRLRDKGKMLISKVIE